LTVEEVYTNAFDATYVAWIEVGSSPYLHNTDTDYIYRLTSKTLTYKEGCWSFPNSAGSGTINSVKLRFEDYRSNLAGDAGVDVYVWDGTSWVYASCLSSYHTSYAWEELDVSSILNTWDKINGAKVYLEVMTATLTDTIYVRRLTRKVDYTPVAVVKKPIMKMDLGPHPRSRLLFAPTLFLGAKGASSSSPPSDPWEGWFMDEV